MAWINGSNASDTWLDRDERQAEIDRLHEIKALIDGEFPDVADMPDEIALDYYDVLTELERLERIHRAEIDVAYFAYEYLSDGHNPDNEDNIIAHSQLGKPHDPIEDMATIHREFFDLCDYVAVEKTNARLAIASARGHNKSGTFSNIFPLHQIVFRKRKYILILSETDSLSKKLVNWSNKQLKHNAKLRADFGPLLDPNPNKNDKDNEEAFLTSTKTLVEASSSGKQLRGKRNGSYRPDLVIVDDPSSDNNENTPEAREKLASWFNQVVMPIGSAATAIIVVGTIVTADGLLSRVLKRRDFKSSFHGAIISPPERTDLWDEYCKLYATADDMAECDVFYETHKDEMERGIELAWSWRWSYRDLMHEKVNIGTRAFNSEFMNKAYSDEERIFIPENFSYYTYTHVNGEKFVSFDGEQIPISTLTISGAWDTAMASTSRSAFNSFVTVGKDEKSGRIYVLDEYSSREKPHEFMQRILERVQHYGHHTVSVESINAYYEFYRQLGDLFRINGVYRTKLNPIKSHGKVSKERRIESLEPMCHNGALIFNRQHTTLLEQMDEYPAGNFVDAIDALTMAVDNVARGKARIVDKPAWWYV